MALWNNRKSNERENDSLCIVQSGERELTLNSLNPELNSFKIRKTILLWNNIQNFIDPDEIKNFFANE